MKITVHPVRRMKKGKTWVWVDCDAAQAQEYALRDRHGKTLRRERTAAEAQRIAALFSKPRSQPARDRSALVGKRWSDVKDRL